MIKNDLAFRVIPCLDIKDNKVVKGVKFNNLIDISCSIECARHYNDNGADELVFLDIAASYENRNIVFDMVKEISKELFIPFTVGGGISKLDHIYKLLNSGSDKVSINSAAIKNPSLIDNSVRHFGSQCIVIAIDVKKRIDNSGWNVFINGGRIDTGIDYKMWAKEVLDRGAGEILLTSMDKDGVKTGYDMELLSFSKSFIDVPLIISGGAGSMEDIKDAYFAGADAALAASIFHYNEIDIPTLKLYLKKNNIPVRI